MLGNTGRIATINWPPYDIAKTGDDDYRITMAVAGFSAEELAVTHEPNMLVMSGRVSQCANDGSARVVVPVRHAVRLSMFSEIDRVGTAMIGLTVRERRQ
jgi:molecular chaperone IbpA